MCTVFNLNPELFQFHFINVLNLMWFVKPYTLAQIFAPTFDFVFLLFVTLVCVLLRIVYTLYIESYLPRVI